MFNSQNFRLTNQRKVILEELKKVKTHPSADEIYEMVRKRLPRISLGTVYRNLEILSEAGEIQKLEVGGNIKRFDGNTDNHYHIRCLECNRIDDVDMPLVSKIEKTIQAETDFKVLGHRIEFIGICAPCQKRLNH